MQEGASSDERWAFECRMRERELALQERRLDHEIKSGGKREGWASPLVVAVFAAAVAAGGNAVVSYVEGNQNRDLEVLQAAQTQALEEKRAEYARIQAMLETDDPDSAAENLRFLVEIGLVSDEGLRARLKTFLEERAPGEGPALSKASGVPDVSALSERMQRGSIMQGLLMQNIVGLETTSSPDWSRLKALLQNSPLCTQDQQAAMQADGPSDVDDAIIACMETAFGDSDVDALRALSAGNHLVEGWITAGDLPSDWQTRLAERME